MIGVENFARSTEVGDSYIYVRDESANQTQ
jgi:hypothetical protein